MNENKPKSVWQNGGITTWIVQKGIYVLLAAGVFWLQLNFASKKDLDAHKAENIKQQEELNKVLQGLALTLREADINRKFDKQQIDDIELRLRIVEKTK